ncbi:hypothetical protein Zmor_012115 [Zophobas morio]|jgi:hypothetical protein|uniref:Mariner Mos1 transposase n=1 Tax=Zophobas morio TaxID=2755281 RepID=A0AA38HHD9_9CUCU|nr:hypothetical protein Zmor_012115 [Zophobas morio]
MEKNRGDFNRAVLLLQNNAPVHTARVAKSAIRDMNSREKNYPPYSSGLAPSYFYLFKVLKKALRGKNLLNENETRSAVDEHW